MGIPSIGDVVVVRFPYSDLSRAKKRPALIVASAEYGDVIICQITSRTYSGRGAIALEPADYIDTPLPLHSYARPDKLLTSGRSILGEPIARVGDTRVADIRAAIAVLFT